MFVQIEETCSCYFFRLGLGSCEIDQNASHITSLPFSIDKPCIWLGFGIDQNRDSLYRAYSTPFGVYIPNTMESCKGAHTGGIRTLPHPFITLLYYQQTIQFQSFKTILHLDTLRAPGTAPLLLLLIKPSFLNPITTLSASGEAPLADAAMSVEDPSQRKGRRIVAAGYHSRGVTWIVRSTVEDLYRSPTQLHNYLS